MGAVAGLLWATKKGHKAACRHCVGLHWARRTGQIRGAVPTLQFWRPHSLATTPFLLLWKLLSSLQKEVAASYCQGLLLGSGTWKGHHNIMASLPRVPLPRETAHRVIPSEYRKKNKTCMWLGWTLAQDWPKAERSYFQPERHKWYAGILWEFGRLFTYLKTSYMNRSLRDVSHIVAAWCVLSTIKRLRVCFDNFSVLSVSHKMKKVENHRSGASILAAAIASSVVVA